MASRGRILIVDDEANARAALSEILREEGYTTETAADGFKALGIFRSVSTTSGANSSSLPSALN
ncbi:MAG TPA: hypothetical protein VL242_35105, partial [Sorangium sp.]|nr:hypothetical protein [Sorangium sp.]